MTARLVGVLTLGASVLLGAAAARAGETAGAAGQREVSGTFIRSDATTLYLEHMGAVVPVEIGRQTRFSGVRSVDELAAGQVVRASFTVMNDTRNVADAISLGPPPSGAPELPSWPDRSWDYGG